MSAVFLTNHGASLESKPLYQRWRDTPVKIREDIAQHGERVKHVPSAELNGIDLLAQVMCYLSLQTAAFGGFGAQGEMLDDLIKASIKSHHRSWLMVPLEKLYDEMKGGRVA